MSKEVLAYPSESRGNKTMATFDAWVGTVRWVEGWRGGVVACDGRTLVGV